MAFNTVLQQGYFTSDGNAKILSLRGDVDWMQVLNYTQIAASANVGVKYNWFRGMAAGTGIAQTTPGVSSALAATAGFTLIDTSVQTLGAGTTITNISNDAIPVVTAAGHGLITGDIVRISRATGAQQLGGYDVRVTRLDADNVQLSWMPQIAAAAAPGANSLIRRLNNEAFYIPKDRVISKITQAASAVVTMAAPHNFTVGQKVRFKVPSIRNSAAYGMIELDGQQAAVTAISTANNTVTVNIDTSGYAAFVFPLTAATNMQLAQLVPVGEDTSVALANNTDILGDATLNTALIGMRLAGGANTPGGAANDVMYWLAGKSFSVN
jgi:hypothetical protein